MDTIVTCFIIFVRYEKIIDLRFAWQSIVQYWTILDNKNSLKSFLYCCLGECFCIDICLYIFVYFIHFCKVKVSRAEGSRNKIQGSVTYLSNYIELILILLMVGRFFPFLKTRLKHASSLIGDCVSTFRHSNEDYLNE